MLCLPLNILLASPPPCHKALRFPHARGAAGFLGAKVQGRYCLHPGWLRADPAWPAAQSACTSCCCCCCFAVHGDHVIDCWTRGGVLAGCWPCCTCCSAAKAASTQVRFHAMLHAVWWCCTIVPGHYHSLQGLLLSLNVSCCPPSMLHSSRAGQQAASAATAGHVGLGAAMEGCASGMLKQMLSVATFSHAPYQLVSE